MHPVRLAVLVCGAPIPIIKEEYGDYSLMVKKMLQASYPALPLDSEEEPFVLDSFDVVHEQAYPKDDAGYLGVIITGSSASAYDDVPWIKRLILYVADLVKSKPHVKLIGICFGLQIISCALGGTCVFNDGKWEAAVSEMELTPVGKEIFGVGVLNVQQMHRDHCPTVPPSFHLLGSSAMTYNQGVVRYTDTSSPASMQGRPLTDIHVFALQGHPEFVGPMVITRVNNHEATGKMDKRTADDARMRANWRNDGYNVVGKVIWAILGVGTVSSR